MASTGIVVVTGRDQILCFDEGKGLNMYGEVLTNARDQEVFSRLLFI